MAGINKGESRTAQKVQLLTKLCERFDVSLGAVALQFPLAHPKVWRPRLHHFISAHSCSKPLHHFISSPDSIADGSAVGCQVACVIPGGADADQVAQNQEYVDTIVPKGVWRALKEADLVRSDAPMPGDAEGRL